jgi:hypothetical protein
LKRNHLATLLPKTVSERAVMRKKKSLSNWMQFWAAEMIGPWNQCEQNRGFSPKFEKISFPIMHSKYFLSEIMEKCGNAFIICNTLIG